MFPECVDQVIERSLVKNPEWRTGFPNHLVPDFQALNRANPSHSASLGLLKGQAHQFIHGTVEKRSVLGIRAEQPLLEGLDIHLLRDLLEFRG